MPWVPITDPLIKEAYGDRAPTVESIFAGQDGLAMLDRPDTVSVFALRPLNDKNQVGQITTLGFATAVAPGTTLSPEEYRLLFAALREPQNYGDQFLGVTSVDFGFKIVSGTNVLDIVFDLETPAVTIARMQTQHAERRAASLALVKAACEIAQEHLQPSTELRKQIGRKRSNTSLNPISGSSIKLPEKD
jgi:hypothetical protein